MAQSHVDQQTGIIPHRRAQPHVSDMFCGHICSISLEQCLSTRDDLGQYLEMLLVFTTGVQLASSESKRGTLLNILQCTGWALQLNYFAQIVHSAVVEKLRSRMTLILTN